MCDRPRELTDSERDRLTAFESVFRSLRDAFVRGDVSAAKASMWQLQRIDLDWDDLRNALHVPKDAGVYADGLRKILLRIPDGWGRWISVGRGWYPIVVALDEALTQLDPTYSVFQVKQKWGNLCYYYVAHTDDAVVQQRMRDLVITAESAAALTCERCSTTEGEVRARTGELPVLTVCDSCFILPA